MVMRPNAWSRRAEEFDALVTGKTGDVEGHRELLDVVAALRSVEPVTARPDFVASLRTQLIAAAEREPARVDEALAARLTPRQRRGSRERRLAAVVGGFAVVSATGSMAMASQSALPGDVLYPVKRAIENAQSNLQPDEASRAETLLAHAEARLDEVRELTARDADPDVISSTLQDFTDQTEQASEATLDDYATTGQGDRIADLRAFAADSMDVLSALGPVVPAESRSILITATQTVRQVDVAAWEACATCADGDLTEVPGFALQSLSNVLSGTIPDTASVTSPGTTVKPNDKPSKAPVLPTETPTGPASPVDPTEVPTKVTEGVGEVIDKVTDGVTDGLNGDGSTPSTGDETLTGTLVDGLGGLLGGLLK
ncbi:MULTISPECIES: DUF5667 domain-containing protein [unclassified Nocardioides]|uniref:DUF5667 domain-containing protein n=1 Tax=unclassified Nocardioides TaxID=2615069 RepID=UPI000A68A47D|nr:MULTISPECIES: DUF5667 domain-containing protein [unclassified Nocardioides]